MSDELKQCPFCGGPAKLISRDAAWFYVRCMDYRNCDAAGRVTENSYDAITMWNRRTPPEATLPVPHASAWQPIETAIAKALFVRLDNAWYSPEHPECVEISKIIVQSIRNALTPPTPPDAPQSEER